MKFKNQKGQAVLIVLLSLSVVLIVVMFVVSRSITDISLSTKEENSLRAFSAAEAGIERALVIGSAQNGAFDDATFNTSVIDFAVGSSTVVYPISLKSGEFATFWFIGHNNNGTLGCTDETCFSGRSVKLCWGDSGTVTGPVPAVEFTVYYTTAANDLTKIRVARATLDPVSRANNFNSASTGVCTINEESFKYYTTIELSPAGGLGIAGWATPGILRYATVKILYNDTVAHKIGIDVSSTGSMLPSQGVKIESDGKFGDANRSIEVYQLHPIAPTIFENAIFSSSGITK